MIDGQSTKNMEELCTTILVHVRSLRPLDHFAYTRGRMVT